MDFNRLIEFWESRYYTEPLMLLAESIALFAALRYGHKDSITKWFIIYISFDLFILLFDWYLTITDYAIINFKSRFISTTNTLIALLELFIYLFYFFWQVLPEKKFSIYFITVFSFYSIVAIIYTFTNFSFITQRFYYVSELIGVLEFIFLIIPCLFFFFRLFKHITFEPLTSRPSFWIATGIFFYAFISIPFYLLNSHLVKSIQVFPGSSVAIFFNLPYAIHFLFITKAFLCRKPLTT